jgi:hypothetical protein
MRVIIFTNTRQAIDQAAHLDERVVMAVAITDIYQ